MCWNLYLVWLKLSAWTSFTGFAPLVYCIRWVGLNMSSLRKRGHHKPLLTCQAIFISLSNCTAVRHSVSFTIHSLKSVKKMNYYHRNWENETKREKTVKIKKWISVMECQQERSLNLEKIRDWGKGWQSCWSGKKTSEKRETKNKLEAIKWQFHFKWLSYDLCL